MSDTALLDITIVGTFLAGILVGWTIAKLVAFYRSFP